MIFTVCDIETTGTDPENDAIVEIACCDVEDGSLNWDGDLGRCSLVFPGRDIPPQASAIHHLIDADVRQQPRASEIIPYVLKTEREDVIYVAHNASFEHSFLHHYLPADARWLCTYKAALRVWPEAPAHSNQVLRYWRGLELDRRLADRAHRAGPDAYVTSFLLIDLLNHASVENMLAWTSVPPLFPTCPIGKKQGWYGKPWSEIDNGALIWMSNVPDDPDVNWNARYQLDLRAKAQQGEVDKWTKIKRDAYVGGATAALRTARTVEDLNLWWKDEAEHRDIHQIVKGTPEFDKLVAMCAEKKSALLGGNVEKLRPAERRMLEQRAPGECHGCPRQHICRQAGQCTWLDTALEKVAA